MTDESQYIVVKRSDMENLLKQGIDAANDQPFNPDHWESPAHLKALMDGLTAAVAAEVLPPLTQKDFERIYSEWKTCTWGEDTGRLFDRLRTAASIEGES